MNKQDELGLDDKALSALLTSEREGWRYADELEQERNRLEAELAALRADAERLHESVCNALEQMNLSPGVAGCAYGRSAHLVLRKALIAHADSLAARKGAP